MKIKIIKIKWETKQTKDDLKIGIDRPRWIQNILDAYYEDRYKLDLDLAKVAKYYNKPLSHFKIKYIF